MAALEGIGIVAVSFVLLVIGFWGYVMRLLEPACYRIESLNGTVLIKPAGDHFSYEYTRVQTVKSVRSDLRLIEFPSHWTGRCTQDKVTVAPLVQGHRLLDGGRSEEDGRQHRWIYLGHPITRGVSVDVGLQQTMEDDIEPMLTYFREGGGRYRTRNLKVVASFETSSEPAQVKGAIWNTKRKVQVGGLECVRMVDRKAQRVDYIVVVPKPHPFHSYGVQWTW